jgi:hypothetical protein
MSPVLRPRRRIAVLFAALLMAPLAHGAAATEYLVQMQDLPLATGLAEQADKSSTFDTPLGPIVTAYAAGNLTPEAVYDFYDDALPKLGWQKQSSGTYHRKAQNLKIDVWGPERGPVKVSFTLSSSSLPQK